MSNLYLAHHGILGQKWGVRRFQNEDGTLTAAGKKRYATKEDLATGVHTPDGGYIRLDPIAADKAHTITQQQRDLNKYKQETYNGIIEDDELIDLLTMEQESVNKSKAGLYEIPYVENFIERSAIYNYQWARHHKDILALDDFNAIRRLGLEARKKKRKK